MLCKIIGGTKVPGNEKSWERKFLGTKGPGNESSRELSLPGVILKADRTTAQTRRPHFMQSCRRRGLCGRVETAHNADCSTAQTIL